MKTNKTLSAAVAITLAMSAIGVRADDQAKANETNLSKMTIHDAADEGYAASEATTATKMDVPIRDVPQSVEVRTGEMMKDMGGYGRMDEIARTVAGVQVAWNGNGGSNIPFLVLRGFSNYGAVMQDGYRRTGGYYEVMDSANIDRVEFLKGPSSVLYGQTGSLGGAVNYISKRPTASSVRELETTVGSWDFYRATLDLGGPLNDSKSVLFRFNAASESGNSFRDFANHDTKFAAPAVTFLMGSNDRLTILADYTKTKQLTDFGFPITPLYQQIPPNRYYGEPSFDHADAWALNTTVEYEHTFNADWKLVAGFSNGKSDWYQRYSYPFVDDTVDPPQVLRSPNIEHIVTTDRDIEARVEGNVHWGAVEHHLLFGISRTTNDTVSDQGTYGDTMPPIDLLSTPLYGATATGFVPPGGGVFTAKSVAPYVQDLVTVTQSFKILAGARYDSVHQDVSYTGSNSIYPSDAQDDSKVSPRVGIVYQPTQNASLYAGYSTSFSPSIGLSRTGQRFKPEEGKQIEIGLKQQLTDSFNANVALYQLTRRNVLTPDPVDPLNFSVQTGEQQSRGIEFDVNGELASSWRINIAYAYLFQGEITEDNTYPVGTRLIGASRQSANVFAVYSFGEKLAGLELGGGVYYAGEADALMPNTFRVASQLRVDALATYRLRDVLHLQLNIQNLLNRRNFSVTDVGYITPGTPRALFVNVGLKF